VFVSAVWRSRKGGNREPPAKLVPSSEPSSSVSPLTSSPGEPSAFLPWALRESCYYYSFDVLARLSSLNVINCIFYFNSKAGGHCVLFKVDWGICNNK